MNSSNLFGCVLGRDSLFVRGIGSSSMFDGSSLLSYCMGKHLVWHLLLYGRQLMN